jgi:hypothetical protein
VEVQYITQEEAVVETLQPQLNHNQADKAVAVLVELALVEMEVLILEAAEVAVAKMVVMVVQVVQE